MEIPTSSPCTDKPGKGFFEIAVICPFTIIPEVMVPVFSFRFSPYIYTSSPEPVLPEAKTTSGPSKFITEGKARDS